MAWPIGEPLRRAPAFVERLPPRADDALPRPDEDPAPRLDDEPLPRAVDPPRADALLVFFAALPRDCDPDVFRPCELALLRVLRALPLLPLDLRVRVAFMD